MIIMEEMGKRARRASRRLALATTSQKNTALYRLADSLVASAEQIFFENEKDVLTGRETGLSTALLDRLTMNSSRLSGIASDIKSVAALPDPVGEVFDASVQPNGLHIHKQRVPIGVLGVIYESRPNVTIDVAGLAIKTGNAAILRGGSETLNSNRILVELVRQALEEAELPCEGIQFVDDPDRERVIELLKLDAYVDMIIPRGGAGLHDFCRRNSHIPVITGGIGICHLFVDESVDLDAALHVLQNAKVQRPTVCNALDTVLVHRAVAEDFLPRLVAHLEQDGVTFRADESAQKFLKGSPQGGEKDQLPPAIIPAGPGDFDTEWLSLVLGLKVVEGLDEAIDHIHNHSTAHSDGILTRNAGNAQRFITEVDSAAVYVNASTRFTDGAQLGLGAEVAVSTQRLHARGPMGLRELTTYKWVIQGENHVRT